MGGAEGDQTTTIRFAPYIEEHHQEFLNVVQTYRHELITPAGHQSPYMGYEEIEIEAAFFGAGYNLTSYPSLYDMYGKFLAGLDVEVLFDEAFEDTINGTTVNNAISQEVIRLRDEINNDILPKYETGMRDINSVMSSTFLVGRAMIESSRLKAITAFSADLRVKLMPAVVERWAKHLDWNRAVIDQYAQILKFYFISAIDTDNHNMEIHAKDLLWPFTILNFEGVALGVLQGAKDVKEDVAGASKAQKLLGGALSGASAGAMIGSAVPGLGTAVGAAIGGIVGLAGGML